jgi:transcriptional regulator with XRE-family HTH domain
MDNNQDLSSLGCSEQDAEVETIQIGARVRSIRKQQGLTIRALAEKSQISPNTLSLIENDRTSPSLRTVGQLAQGLGVSLMTLLEPEPTEPVVVHQRHGQRHITKFDSGSIENLGDGMPPLGAEPILVTLGGQQSISEDVSHTGREFVYCISGSVDCYIGGAKYPLTIGDSLLFDAKVPHRWENIESTPSQLLVIFCPLDARDHPVEKHLGQ